MTNFNKIISRILDKFNKSILDKPIIAKTSPLTNNLKIFANPLFNLTNFKIKTSNYDKKLNSSNRS